MRLALSLAALLAILPVAALGSPDTEQSPVAAVVGDPGPEASPGSPRALPELRHLPPRSLYDKTLVKQALTRGTHLVYGAELSGANAATAVTMAESAGLSVLHFPAAAVAAPEIQALAMAVRPGPLVVLGHFASAADTDFKQKLDAGMHGAVLDGAEDPAQVRAFLDRLFFSPLGNRPGGPAYASGFLAHFQEMVQEANSVVIGGIGVSTARGVERVDELVPVDGLTLVMVDPAGIARSLGVAEGSPEQHAAVARVEQAALRHGVALGGRASTREEAARLSRRGYRHVVLGSDLGAVRQAFAGYQDARRVPARTPDRRPGEWNPVNRWMKEGRVVEVGFLMTPDLPMARELAARSDALWIDAEHGPYSPEAVKDLLGRLPADLPVLVRVQSADHPELVRYLEAGARGIVAPNVGSADEAVRFVARVKAVRPDATAVAMVETRAGLEHAEEIAAVPGLDLVHLGPYDLALSLRVPMGSNAHVAAVARIEEAARKAGVPLGGAAPTRTRAAEMASRGYRLATTVSDQEAVHRAFRDLFADPSPQVRVVRAGAKDPLDRYVGPTILRDREAPWHTLPDGTRVRVFHLGDDLTVQAVRSEALPAEESAEHSHDQSQVTIVEKGRTRLEIHGQTWELGPGDIGIVPAGVQHRFTDLTPELQVLELLLPRWQGER